MSRRLRIVLIVVAALVVAAAGYLLLRPRPSDEERIIATLRKGAEAVERRDVADVMDCISDDYHDAAGLTKGVLRVLAWRARDIEGDLQVTLGTPVVELQDHRAHAQAEVTVRAVDASGTHTLFEGSVDFVLRREKRHRWRVIDSEGWQQALDVEQGF